MIPQIKRLVKQSCAIILLGKNSMRGTRL